MDKIHFTSFALTVTSCLAEIQNGEFAINLTDNAKKENFEKTFDTLKGSWDSLICSPKEGGRNNNYVFFHIEKDKIKLLDSHDIDNDKYNFYNTYIDRYVTLEERVYGSYNLMHNTHKINDIKTCEVEFDIPQDCKIRYKDLEKKIDDLKKNLFNDKDYGFLIFNDVYIEYIKEKYRSFNIELKDEKFIITANKDYLEEGAINQYEYTIKVFFDQTKAGDYVINDKYKDFNLEKVRVFTYSLGNKKSADNLIEDFKKYRYNFNINGYKLCNAEGKEIKGNNLEKGTYYVKNDKFFTKKTILKLYDKFLNNLNNKLVNGVEELISKDSISEADFRNKMTAINDFFKKFEDKKNEKDETDEYKEYKSLFKDNNYGEIINSKFEYLNELRRKLMAMYLYKNVIANVTAIINKLKANDFSGLNIDLFFTDNSELRNYSNNFIYNIYENFKEDFIECFSVNRGFYYNDVTKQDYSAYEYNCVEYEISNLIGHQEYENYSNLEKELEKLLKENKGNLFTNIYKIDVDKTNLKETDANILTKLINEIEDIKKKVLYRKPGMKLSYISLFNALDLHKAFYEENNKHRVLFFDIFVDGKKVVFDYTKDLKILLDEVLPEGKPTILLKFYDCVEALDQYGHYLNYEDFNKLLIAQIGRKAYEEKEIDEIKKITSLTDLKTKYKEIINKKDKYDFWKEIKCINEAGVCNSIYKHSDEKDKDYIRFDNLPSIYNAVATRLQQLEKDEMDENERKGVEEIENKYKGLVDLIIQKINSTESLEKLKELPYSKKEDIKKDLENKVKSEVDNYDNKKSKISDFDIFVNNYVEQVYNAYNAKSSGIIKDEEEKKIKAAEEEEKRKKDEEDKRKKDEEEKKKKDEGNNTVQISTEGNNKQQQIKKRNCCKSNKQTQEK